MAVSAPPRRRRSGAWILALLVLAAFFVGVPLLFCAVLAGKTTPIEKGAVVTIRLQGSIPEGPANNPFAKLSLAASGAISLHELRELAAEIKKDDRVAGVLLDVGPLDVGFGTIEDIRDVIADLRESKKPVQALLTGDFVDEKSYYAAVAADRVVMNPEASLALNGFDAKTAFYAGTLKKIHAEAQFIGFKKYKSAIEPFTRENMSDEYKEVLHSILGDYHARLLTAIKDRRGVSETELQKLFDEGGLTSTEAVAAKLVDDRGYYDQVEEAIRSAAAPEVKEPHVVSAAKYLFNHHATPHGDKIAVIYAVGPITAAPGSNGIFGGEGISGPDLAATIREAADDKNVKAILMRVNSPGGSAVGSDFIRREVERARKKKPFVVSMGGVAGSGGYWIAMDSDEIVAQPSTITGSIGVFMGKFNIKGTYEMVDAHIDGVTVGGANADILSPWKTMDAKQVEHLTAQVGGIYHDFVDHVATGRKMKYDDVDAIAGGRIWSGAQGKKNGLVDEVGGFAVAVAETKKKANLTGDVQLEIFPREKNGFEALAEILSGGASVAQSATRSPEEILLDVKKEMETPAIWAITPDIEIK